MSTDVDTLVVATTRRWVADDFAAPCARAGLELVHSWGLDVPDLTGRTPAWWTPTEHAARVLASGTNLPLIAPGPLWLSRVPQRLTGRRVWSGTVDTLKHAPAAGWCKPAEMKVEALPSQWWDRTSAFAAACASAGLPGDSAVQVASRRLDIVEEHRTFVLHGEVVATSPYLVDGVTWTEDMTDDRRLHHQDAAAFAGDVCTTMRYDQAPAYTLDVALTREGRWVVLEANPVWSSASYGADLDAVLAATTAGTDHAGHHPDWAWQPDPHLLARADRQARLPVRR